MPNELTPGFSDEVQRQFAFLRHCGFGVAETTANVVRFESDRVWVTVSLGERDREVAVNFGRVESDEELSFVLFLRAYCPDADKTLGDRVATTMNHRDSLLRAHARLLESEGQRILAADCAIFRRMTGLSVYDLPPYKTDTPSNS